jgi:hypothetical protein
LRMGNSCVSNYYMKTAPFILFKFATRSRPKKCLNGILNIISNLKDKKNYVIWITADENDRTMYNKSFLNDLKPYLKNNVVIQFGDSKNKIDAINRDMKAASETYDWDILVNFSDDMVFTENNFDNRIRKDFSNSFPNFDGNLHYNDGYTEDKVCTMNITGRTYYNRFNYIYNPEYISLWCDNEFTEVAKRMNKIAYFKKVIFKHEHPANIGGFIDEQYIKTESYYEIDNQTFERRKSQNFYITN